MLVHDILSLSPPQSIKDKMIGERWDENTVFARVISAPVYFAHPNF